MGLYLSVNFIDEGVRVDIVFLGFDASLLYVLSCWRYLLLWGYLLCSLRLGWFNYACFWLFERLHVLLLLFLLG